jgi:tRNA(Ile)-lysidine synthase
MAGTQKLKKLFINRKIPATQRRRTPVLTGADTILWVVGVRRGNHAVIGRQTQRVLRVEARPLTRPPEMSS